MCSCGLGAAVSAAVVMARRDRGGPKVVGLALGRGLNKSMLDNNIISEESVDDIVLVVQI